MKIILAGGGTGGHLFPGIALAQEYSLVSRIPNPESQILFLCTNRPFDKTQLERYKFNYYVLPSPRLPSLTNPISVIRFLISLLTSLYYTNRYFSIFRPDVVFGLGGYGSFSSLLIAIFSGIPFVLLEQNVLPGKITSLFHPFARAIFCQWGGSIKYLRNRKGLKITGSPIRQEILSYAKDSSQDKLTCPVRSVQWRGIKLTHNVIPSVAFASNGVKMQPCSATAARRQLGLTKEYILLVIGGSQGAEALNKAIIDNIDTLKKLSDRLGIIHLTGEKDCQSIKDTYQKAGIEAIVKSFVEEMGVIYAASDLALSRAGGIAIAEMVIFGLPMLLVPYPLAADNHQFFNALEVQRNGDGVIIEQNILHKKIGNIISSFMSKSTSNGVKSLARLVAAKEIINYLTRFQRSVR